MAPALLAMATPLQAFQVLPGLTFRLNAPIGGASGRSGPEVGGAHDCVRSIAWIPRGRSPPAMVAMVPKPSRSLHRSAQPSALPSP